MNEPPPTRSALIAFTAGCGIAALVLIAIAAFFFLSQTRRNPDTIAGVTATSTRTRLTRTSEPDFFDTATPAPPALTAQPTSDDLLATVTPLPLAVTVQPTLNVVIPTVTVQPTSNVVIPTVTPILSSPPTLLPNVPTISVPGNVRRRIGNGPDALAHYVPVGNFVLDGALYEWGADTIPLTFAHFGADSWQGPDDLSGTGQLGWNEQYLLLAVTVRDDAHVQTQRGWEMFRGDSVEFWIDADLQGDFDIAAGDGDDWQFGFSPGDFGRLPPEGVVYIPYRNTALNQQVFVAAQPTGNGYTLEAMIPWSMLQVQPSHGMVLGYTIDLSDNDVPGTALQQTQVTHNPNFRFQMPSTFGNLVLE